MQPVLLDFRLTVWYHGLKATQYFSKFTQESIRILKADLTILGLPHPRKENISLLSHGAVECFWPSAEKHHILHKNLIAKTRPTPEFNDIISELSILSITVKESPTSRPPIAKPDLAKPTSLKRPYEQRAPSVSVAPSSHFSGPSNGQRTMGNLPHQSTSSFRPYRGPPSAGRSPPYHYDDSSRPSKVMKTHAQGFQLSPKSVSHGHSSHSFEFSAPRNRPQPHPSPPMMQRVNRSPYYNRSFHPRHVRSPSDVMKMNPPTSSRGTNVVKVEEEVVDAFLNNLDLHSTASRRQPPMESISFPPKRKTPDVSLNDTHSDRKGRYSPNNTLASTVRIERQRPTAAVDLDNDRVPGLSVSKSRMTNLVGTAIQLPTPPTSAPSPSFSLHSNLQSVVSPPTSVALNSTSLLRPGTSAVHKIPPSQGAASDVVPPSLPLAGTKETKSPAIQAVARDAATQRLTHGPRDVSRNTTERSEGHDWRKHAPEGMNGNPDQRNSLELERIRKELDAVKNELEEERRLRKEDKKLLEAERQRREETEHALEDVKRECRQPFVVPSLLDTFVELSKLTTRGLKVSGSKVSAAPSNLGYPSPQERREVVENTSRVVVNSQDVTDSAQQTVVKHEPLDDDVVL